MSRLGRFRLLVAALPMSAATFVMAREFIPVVRFGAWEPATYGMVVGLLIAALGLLLPMKALGRTGLGIAIALTLFAMPYAWSRVYIGPMILGEIEPAFLTLLVSGMLSIVALSWRLAEELVGERWVRWTFAIMAVGWIAALSLIIVSYANFETGLAAAAGLFVAGTLWVPWAAWLGYRGIPGVGRLAVLGVLLALVPAFALMVRVRGMDGDTRVWLAWRSTPKREFVGPIASSPTPLPISIGEPTPDDSPQYYGPTRNGQHANVKLADWDQQPPREAWRITVGPGWSGFAVVGGYAFTAEQRGSEECVTCYRLADGAAMWSHGVPTHFESTLAGDGPRATPTVVAGRVFAVGATGRLVCLEAGTGKTVWSADLLADFQVADNLMHGVCGSPLVDGDRVIVCPVGIGGPYLAAYHKDTGDKLWSAGDKQASYSSPVLWEVDITRQIVLHNAVGLAGHDSATGRLLWLFPWSNKDAINCAQPILDAAGAGTILASTGYGTGSALVRVKRAGPDLWVVETVWHNARAMKAKFTSAMLFEGHAYGLDDGIFSCVDAATGKIKWKDGRYQHGQAILAGDRLIVQAESGELVMVAPSPAGLTEVGRVTALGSKTWNVPCLAGNWLLVRNDREAVCYELSRR